MFIDVLRGTSSNLCVTPSGSGQDVKLRTWAFSDTYHGTIATLSLTGYDREGCHYIQLGMIDSESRWRGNARFTHANGSSGTVRAIYAGPPPYGAITDVSIGTTYNEPASCPWSGQHVHQGFNDITCPATNGSLGASTIYLVWNLFRWVHQMDYQEGHGGC